MIKCRKQKLINYHIFHEMIFVAIVIKNIGGFAKYK